MREIFSIVVLLALFMGTGAVAFRLTEGWDWLQCLYFAVIVMTTVGMAPSGQLELNDASRVFVIVYLILGLGVFSYSVTKLGQRIVNLEMRALYERRKMEAKIAALRDHFIVCGLGRMGRTICGYLASKRQSFVVIDTDSAHLAEACREFGWLYLDGDATRDEVLKKAGITRAKALATVLPTDADNVYVILSARLLNEGMQLIARASDENAGEKMTRAGATRVVSPYSTGATKIARFMLNPSMEDFLEVTDEEGSQMALAEVQLTGNCELIGKSLQQTDLRERGVMVLSIRRITGERLMPPSSLAQLAEGDSLYVFGTSAAVAQMIQMSNSTEQGA